MNERVLVTGADGFVGRYVCRKLIESGYSLRAGVRNVESIPDLKRAVPGLSDTSLLGDLGASPELRGPLTGVSADGVLLAFTPLHACERTGGKQCWDPAALEGERLPHRRPLRIGH